MASESAVGGSIGLCLLVVVGEVFEEENKDLIVNSIVQGLKSIDASLCGHDVNFELQNASENLQISEENEVKSVSYKSDGLFLEILIKPHLKQFSNKLKTFLTHPSHYHHLIYAGSHVRGSSKWLLPDATFSFSNFSDCFKSSEVVAALKDGSLRGTMTLNCKAGLEWSENLFSKLSSTLCFKLNPPIQEVASNGITNMMTSLSHHITFTNLQELLEESSVVGSIRFHHPTIYIFPAGSGSSCLFGVSGFNLLVDGGFVRKSCFWDFARHLDRLDALLLTHIGEDNLFGVASALERKKEGMVNPEVGCVFANCISNTTKLQGGGGLEIDVGVESGRLVEMMKAIGIKPQPCIGTTLKGIIQPINLYHKVGHGSLDLYILTPLQDNRPLKDFLTSWSKNNNPFVSKGSSLPLSSLASVCAVVVWQPFMQAPTRLLFPGTASQQTVLEALDRLTSMPIFQSFEGKPAVKRIPSRTTNKVASIVSPRSSTTIVKSPRSDGSLKFDKKWPVKKEGVHMEKNGEKSQVDEKKEGNGLLSRNEVEKNVGEIQTEKEKNDSSTEKPFEKPDEKANEGDEKVEVAEAADGVADLMQFEAPMNLPPPTSLSTKQTLIKSEPRPVPTSSRKLSRESPRQKHSQKAAFHCDLAYIPNHGDPRYVDRDFFCRVKARYYVLSNPNPSPSLLTSILEAKEEWEGEVVLIPTHDTEVLRFWMAAHHDQLSQAHLSVAPAANRCSIQLQDHHTSCAAYRLEF